LGGQSSNTKDDDSFNCLLLALFEISVMISLVFYDYRSFIGLKFVVGLTLADCKASRRIFGLLSEINYGGS
jgi:hypothetical protein